MNHMPDRVLYLAISALTQANAHLVYLGPDNEISDLMNAFHRGNKLWQDDQGAAAPTNLNAGK